MSKLLQRIVQNKRTIGLFLFPIVVGFLTTQLSNVLLNTSEPLNRLEGMADDAAWLSLPRIESNPKIVMVLIDSETCSALGLSDNLLFLPRRFFSSLVTGLDKAHARVIAMDMALNGQEPQDSGFSKALSQVSNSQLVLVKRSKKTSESEAENRLEGTEEELLEPELNPALEYPNITLAHGHAMEAEGMMVGAFPWLQDPKTKKGIAYIGYAASVLTMGQSPAESTISNDYELRCGTATWELGGNMDYMVRWTKASNPFTTLSFQKALDLIKSGNTSIFKESTIVVGESRPGKDEVKTAPYGNIPGVLFVAHTINTFLLPPWQRVRWADSSITMNLSFVLAAIAAGLTLSKRRALGLLGALACLAIAIAYPSQMASLFKLRAESLPPILSVSLSILIASVCMSLLTGKIDTRTAGILDEATIVFADIVGSTKLTSEIGARKYQEIYTDFISTASSIIEKEGGSIERTRGDGFLAVFRSHSGRESALAAIRCAEKIQNAAKLPIRQSIEFGVVSGGYVSESGRRVWSSTGNTVNLAARMLDSCDLFQTEIVVGPTAARLVEESRALEKLGRTTYKGFESEFMMFGIEKQPKVPHDQL